MHAVTGSLGLAAMITLPTRMLRASLEGHRVRREHLVDLPVALPSSDKLPEGKPGTTTPALARIAALWPYAAFWLVVGAS